MINFEIIPDLLEIFLLSLPIGLFLGFLAWGIRKVIQSFTIISKGGLL